MQEPVWGMKMSEAKARRVTVTQRRVMLKDSIRSALQQSVMRILHKKLEPVRSLWWRIRASCCCTITLSLVLLFSRVHSSLLSRVSEMTVFVFAER